LLRLFPFAPEEEARLLSADDKALKECPPFVGQQDVTIFTAFALADVQRARYGIKVTCAKSRQL
jgi:hypothetical protein